MKKYLIALAGFVGLTTSSMSTIVTVLPSKLQNSSLSTQASPVRIRIPNQFFDQYVPWGMYKEIKVEVNLSSNGIKGIDGLHEYNTIELPDIEAVFEANGVKINFNGDKWGAKNKKIGSEDWLNEFKQTKWVGDWKMIAFIDTAAELWYAGNGDLMMILAYKIYGISVEAPNKKGLNISFRTRFTVNIY